MTDTATARLPYVSITLRGATAIFSTREGRDAALRQKAKAGCYTNTFRDVQGPALHFSYRTGLPSQRSRKVRAGGGAKGFPHEVLADIDADDSYRAIPSHSARVRDAGGTATRRNGRVYYTLNGLTLVKELA